MLPLRLLLALSLCVACGKRDRPSDAESDARAPMADSGAADAGQEDATVGDAGLDGDAGREDGRDDGGRTDAGVDGGLDPARCPIGLADGCCPLLRYGGRDPDCPSLGCESLEASAPIELDDISGTRRATEWKGGTGLAWTGRELALARTDWDAAGEHREIVFELRGPDGSLRAGPIRTPERTSSLLDSRAGEAALGYVVDLDRFVYANATGRSYDAVGIERDGSLAFTTATGLSWCNWNSGGWVEMFPTGDRVLAVGHSYTCEGSTDEPRASEILADGSLGLTQHYGTGGRRRHCWGASAACDLECATPRFAFFCSNENELQLRGFDPVSLVAEPSEVLARDFVAYPRGSAIASDGERFLVVHTPGSVSARSAHLQAQIYRPGVGWEGPTLYTPVFEGMMRLIWTGDGYLLAATTWSPEIGEHGAPLGSQHRFSVRLWHFDADGRLRETFDNDPGLPGLHPYLAWAGGQLAISWVRPVDPERWPSDEPRRFLRMYRCP